MKKAIYTIFAVAVFLFAAETSYACSCFASDAPLKTQVEGAYKDSAAVFTGKVLSVEPSPGEATYVTVKFAVSKTWKGSKGKTISITTEKDSAMCGYNFAVGKQYVVYAHAGKMALSTSNCSRTASSMKNADVRYLKALAKRRKG